MNYIESISKNPLRNFWNSLKLNQLSSTCKKAMKQLLRQVDYLKSTVYDIDRQLSEWKIQQSKGKQLNEHIEAFTALRDFYEDNGKLLMIELDVTESFCHIVRSKEDWEYRFFARRLFTLMHETRNALLASLGSHRNQMMKFAPTTFAQYESKKKAMEVFINTHGAFFKKVRNTSDAHKGKPFREQIQCIEQIDITSSFEMIHEFQVHLANISAALFIVLGEMGSQINKQIFLK